MYEVNENTIPTQVAHPWRSVTRTIVQALLGLAVILPVIVTELGVETIPWVAAVVTVSGAVTRIMTHPAVETWLARYLPFLATGVHTEQETTDISEPGTPA